MSGEIAPRAVLRPTPGPWRIYGPNPARLGGRSLTILAGKGKTRFGVASIEIINPNDAAEASANARLIAAAPELYEALDEFVNAIRAYESNHGKAPTKRLHDAMLRGEFALAKTGGEQ